MKAYGRKSVYCSFLIVVSFILTSASISFGATQQDSLQKLYNAAKKDKEVVWQWLGAVKHVKKVADAFQKKYPDIKITTISIGSTAIASRIIVEANAGRLSVDVGSSLVSYLMPVIDRDLAARNNWSRLIGINPKRVSFNGCFININESAPVWVYNTNLVSKNEAPKTWEDTLNPKWKGKIAVRAAPSGFTPIFPIWKKDKQKAIGYLEKLAKQEVVPGKRVAEVVDRMARGEIPISLVTIGSTWNAIQKGAPLALCPISPVAGEPTVLFIPKGAPHPEAAKLLMAWLASPEGVKALAGSGWGPLTPANASPNAKLMAENKIDYISIETSEDLKEYTGPFSDAVMKIMRFIPK